MCEESNEEVIYEYRRQTKNLFLCLIGEIRLLSREMEVLRSHNKELKDKLDIDTMNKELKR